MGTEDRGALMRRLRESSVNLCAKYDFLKEVMWKSDEIDYNCKVQICMYKCISNQFWSSSTL